MNDSKIIQVEVVQGDIEHRVTLQEFRDAMIQEIGSVTWTMTRKQFEKKVVLAVDRVIQGIRDGRQHT
jgi:hypothetical protein